ncbi:MAG: hypothetical protein M1822_004476 [Bathelium mastoideum]|nr:MAG: hypothetical protein M1822_004476 [Bathelium mastoideum]
MEVWSGDIHHNHEIIKDIHLSTTEQNYTEALLPPSTTLHFLSLINVNYIPLYMINGSNLSVWTATAETTTWFETFFYLFGTPDLSDKPSPTSAEQLQENLPNLHEQLCTGILTRVQYGENVKPKLPCTTEIVFYLSQPVADTERFAKSRPEAGHPFRARFGEYRIHALPLSSDLLKAIEFKALDPPLSEAEKQQAAGVSNVPKDGNQVELLESRLEPAKEPLEYVPRRKRAASLFEEATERRRKARRHGGESIALAASKHAQQISASQMYASVEKQSPSSSEPLRNGGLEGVRGSPLGPSHSRAISQSSNAGPSSKKEPDVHIDSDGPTGSLLEERNKETISRVVMAGMRLYGLSYRTRRSESRRQSVAPDAQPENGRDGLPNPVEADSYKLVYHQTYKSAVFAFRQYLRDEMLHTQMERVREVVDRLLAVFCCDPLEGSSQSESEDDPLATAAIADQTIAHIRTGSSGGEMSEKVQGLDIRQDKEPRAVDNG